MSKVRLTKVHADQGVFDREFSLKCTGNMNKKDIKAAAEKSSSFLFLSGLASFWRL